MSDTTKDLEATDPPTNTGGGGTAADTEESQPEAVIATDPPTNTGGGGSA
jgi:hypothetical protein